MAVIRVRGCEAGLRNLPGRVMTMLVTPGTRPDSPVTLVTIDVQPGMTARPCHAHLESVELIYIVDGQGEAWVDGATDTFEAGDVVVFPIGCKHMIRNPGGRPMKIVCIYVPPTIPEEYVLYEGLGL
jgi:mannose-6-phosphate isomerase-like protein (cupin superfamily)